MSCDLGSSFNASLSRGAVRLSTQSLTLCGDFVEVGDGDVRGVVAVALMRLREAVHMQQLPVGHLPVRVKYLLAFLNGPHANHLQTVLRKME